jgi:hypothetical protein
MHDAKRVSAELRNQIDDMQSKLAQEKDHLTIESQTEFENLSRRWEDLKAGSESELGKLKTELGETADIAAEEFRNGFQRLKDLLKKNR